MRTLVWLKVLLVSAALLVTSVSSAQTPQVLLLGSRQGFSVMAVAASSQDPITKSAAPCSDAPFRFWSFSSVSSTEVVQALDSRAPLNARITPHNGRIWVAWNADAELIPAGPNAVVCAYLTGDSGVTQRLFFGTNAGATATLNLGSALPTFDAVNCPSGIGLPGQHQVIFINDTVNALPCGVFLLINGKQFNGVVTDIRPEDALYANTRALQPCNPPASCATDKVKNGLGYIAPLERLSSSFTPTHNDFIAYAIAGSDPISGFPVTPGAVLQLGAVPVLLLANVTQGTNPGDFSQNVPNDILNEIVAQVFSASTDVNKIGSTRTCDVTGSLTLCSPLNILNPSPSSAVFNTTEFQLVRNKGTVLSQEIGVDPADNSSAACTTFPVSANCGNPFYHSFTDGAIRRRVAEVTNQVMPQMIKELGGQNPGSGCVTDLSGVTNGLTNGIGYNFWNFADFSDPCTQTNVRYLKLDGKEPLLNNYETNPRGAGVFPQCTVGPPISCDAVPFRFVVNGDYRAWTILRVIMKNSYGAPGVGPSVPYMVLATQDMAHATIPDFAPFLYCTGGVACTPAVVDTTQHTWIKQPIGVTVGLSAFRSHYSIPSVGGVSFDSGAPAAVVNGTNQSIISGYQPWSENGGDMAGATFSVRVDIDSLADTGTELIEYLQ